MESYRTAVAKFDLAEKALEIRRDIFRLSDLKNVVPSEAAAATTTTCWCNNGRAVSCGTARTTTSTPMSTVQNDTPTLRSSSDAPFTEDVDLFPAPPNFKMPLCESYDGTEDPMEHLAHFTSSMNLYLVPDQIMCQAFLVTLNGAARVWFQHLTPRSISCWAQLVESFLSNFLTSRIQRKNSSALFRIVQGPKESWKSYYARFNTEELLIDHLDLGVTFTAMARVEA
ncbi:hypothetical protein RJ639_001448 [Escallonia herrerae]|uniref:Retrotransposon gag domain-containing protein n=1 Tax=Escallonia herrerae TaxID=1293975 RepID=A0AA89BHU8_9ASTE|nr:hypothetical protein RJ639_001448 [Escallonia herrerae]